MMSCPVFIISLALSLLVLLGGLFLLAYAKKEGLGKMTKLASYVAVTFGTICFVGGLIGSLMCGSCHKGKCDKDGMKCTKEVRIEYHDGMSKGGHCEKNASENCCKAGKGECSESKCEKGMEAEHCKKDGKDCCKEAIQKCNKEEAAKK